ncbi:DUF881 domain-containing protein [Nocardioides mangrovicus]|uniref:DUF881 domain-containing protein n=1 Tax=Nocardioides mangrovicus TaxID=2478913 RepID=A0A3L8P203_9ACTN|nr:DUF881 domain-containing protein [Nocardioides mangrovicus]RLV48649.1 DUF881 domain-containing protein [Nocardioides mangrovicus]
MSSPADRDREQAGEQQERISQGLIAYLSGHAMDEDYGWITRNQPATGGRGARVAATVTLAAFGLLVLTAATQTSRSAVTVADERTQLIEQITARRQSLDSRIDTARRLTEQNQVLTRAAGTTASAALLARVERLALLTGQSAAHGRGVTVVADDAANADSDRERVLDKDLQRLVNALWEAGAEAISINGQRLTNLSPIRQAGTAINVNFIPLRPPYRLLVLGDPDRLPSRFAATTDGAAWFDLEREVGLRLSITKATRLSLPAAGEQTLRYAQPATQKQGGAS